MLVIKAKVNEYVKAGAPVFVYSITSNQTDPKKAEAELADYKKSCGDYYRESDAKEPLMFSQRPMTAGAKLTKTTKGRYQVLSEDLEETATAAAAAIETFKNQFLGKLQALGIKPAEMRAAMLAGL